MNLYCIIKLAIEILIIYTYSFFQKIFYFHRGAFVQVFLPHHFLHLDKVCPTLFAFSFCIRIFLLASGTAAWYDSAVSLT